MERAYFAASQVLHDLWSAVQDGVRATETLASNMVAFVYALWTEGQITLGESNTASTTKFVVTVGYDANGDPVTTGNLCGPNVVDANGDLPVIVCEPGSESHLRNMAVMATALFRSGTKAGGFDATTPAGAMALVTAVTGAETKRDLDKVAGSLRPVLMANRVAVGQKDKPETVRGAAHKALNPTKPGEGTGDVRGNRRPDTLAGVANTLAGEIRVADWDRDGALAALVTIKNALTLALADVVALIDEHEADAVTVALEEMSTT